MLEVKNLYKSFDDNLILENISLNFETSKIYGILGINGAGKSTILRTLSGIYIGDKGCVTLDNEDVYENIKAKSEIFYLPDENTYLPCETIDSNIKYYKTIYNTFDNDLYESLNDLFKLDTKKSLKSFSKGMKKQAQLMITLSFVPRYLILDETFDGLDPLIRIKIKKYLIDIVEEKNICIIISTHNISDIENLIDFLVIVNNKKVEVSNVFDGENEKYFKAQLCFKGDFDINDIKLNFKEKNKIGSIHTIIFENSKEEIEREINKHNPIVFDITNVTKEEFFMLEVEGK